MMLKELGIGKRFEFEDKRTAIELVEGLRISPKGVFIYVGVGESGAAILRAGIGEYKAIAATHLRHIIPIF